jgi:hypothetical protein
MTRVCVGTRWRLLLVAFTTCFALFAATASAAFASGRVVADGHDPDYHCGHSATDASCDFFPHAVPFARGAAPDPTKPVLVLDNGALLLQTALTNVFGAALPVQVVDPSSPTFASLPIDTAHYSAIIVASDTTCGGCDLNTDTTTPDTDAIVARKADIAAFYQAGGGVIALSGGQFDSQPAGRCDYYYSFLPVAVPACAVVPSDTDTFPLTPNGAALGFLPTDFPFPHNEFTAPAAGAPLQAIALDGTQPVALFGAGPLAKTMAAAGVSFTGATLNGTVNPEFSATTYHFEYGTTTSYGSRAPAADAAAGSDSTDHPVSLAVTGLAPGTTYHYRVVATNVDGTTNGADMTFTTRSAPSVVTGSANSVGTTAATVTGTVSPHGFATSYQFEYGTSTTYGHSTTMQSAGAGTSSVAVHARLTGLQPGAVYHYRLVATSGGVTVHGVDRTFKTKALIAVAGVFAGPCTRAASASVRVSIRSLLLPRATVRLDGTRIAGGKHRSLRLTLALSKLHAGTHHLTVSARSAAGTTTRTITFRVCAAAAPHFTG